MVESNRLIDSMLKEKDMVESNFEMEKLKEENEKLAHKVRKKGLERFSSHLQSVSSRRNPNSTRNTSNLWTASKV